MPLTEHHHDAPADDNNPDDNAKVYISERLKNKKTLLVEDIAINRLIAQSLLEQAGLLVECAENGLEATKMAQLKDYDLIIMDIQMPVMDGFEATKIIRGYPQYRDTPIVAMTANALSEDQDRSLAAGMNSHLTKPMQYEEVIAELERYF